MFAFDISHRSYKLTQTLNVSYADYTRHFQIYLSLLASRGVEIQMCLFLMLGLCFFSHGTAAHYAHIHWGWRREQCLTAGRTWSHSQQPKQRTFRATEEIILYLGVPISVKHRSFIAVGQTCRNSFYGLFRILLWTGTSGHLLRYPGFSLLWENDNVGTWVQYPLYP